MSRRIKQNVHLDITKQETHK